MRKPKLHNRIARSVVTLPLCAMLAIGMWWLPQRAFSPDLIAGLVLTAFATYVILETNNTYQVLRVRSRMMASVWVFGAGCFITMHPFSPSLLAAFCLSVSIFLLFRTYQQSQPTTDTFHVFLLLSLGSIVFPPVLLLAPFFLWYLLVFMRSLSFRSFLAALVGLSLPFWFWTGWLLWDDDITPLLSWWTDLLAYGHMGVLGMTNEIMKSGVVVFTGLVESITVASLIDNAPFVLLAFLTLWTTFYYLTNSYDDKIRTRMMMYVYMMQSWIVLLFALLTFQFAPLTPLLLLCCSPLVAHYFTLRNTWLALIVFVLTLVAFIIIFVNPLEILDYFEYLCTLKISK
ncbi:MAG: hypothetical protein J6Y04_07210 [Bacteroidaceae bacterium]|nr:hypothetical protein [Bacteroidaceae bacterium]